jgi:hypothetical protein
MKSVLALVALTLVAPLGAATAAEPIPVPKPVFFAMGSTSGTVGGRVQRGARDLYSLKAAQGQTLTVTITVPDDNATFEIYEPGTVIGRDSDQLLVFKGKALHAPREGEDTTRFHGRLPATGTYIIAVASTLGGARYSMDIKIQ